MSLDLARRASKEKTPTELSQDTTVRTIIDPTQMSDSEATRMGRKIYRHGGSYNGGGAPTLTQASLSSVNGSNFIPYQMQDGSWRMKFNFTVTLSSEARTSATIAIAGVVFSNDTAHNVSAAPTTGTALHGAFTTSGGDVVTCVHASSATTIYRFSGDVALDSKPSWAY